MKRNHNSATHAHYTQQGLFRQMAFHEAGHAVTIYLRNKQKHLPPVFFQIAINTYPKSAIEHNYLAKVEGGRLIENLALLLENRQDTDKQEYLTAFEADIINLLAGPLAEAKYVAQRDGEEINQYQVNMNALGFYGGTSDFEAMNDYFQCFVEDIQQRSDKIEQLFLEAFEFIDLPQHWKIISALAIYIIDTSKAIISFEEIMAVIEDALHDSKKLS